MDARSTAAPEVEAASFNADPARRQEEFILPDRTTANEKLVPGFQETPKDHSNLQMYGKGAESATGGKSEAQMTPRTCPTSSVESVVCTPDTSYGKEECTPRDSDVSRRNGALVVTDAYPSAFQMHGQNPPINAAVPNHNVDNVHCWTNGENCGNVLKDHQQFGGQIMPYPICLLKTAENLENATSVMHPNKPSGSTYPANEVSEPVKPFESKLEEMKRKDRERKRRLRQDPDYVVKEREKQRLYKQKRRKEIDAARTYVRCVSEISNVGENIQSTNLQTKDSFATRQPVEMFHAQQPRDSFSYPPSSSYRCSSKEVYDLAVKIKQEAPEGLPINCGREGHITGNERQFVEVIHMDDREKQRLQKQRLYKQKQRQDPDFRLREKYKQRYAKQMKRQDPEYRERERELNRMLKRRKRMDPQFREKEREIGRMAAVRKMMDPERRRQVSERQSMRYFLLMQNPEYREKIRERRRLYYMKNRQKISHMDSEDMEQSHDRANDRVRNYRRLSYDKEHQKNRRAWKAKMSSIMQDQAFHTWMNLMGQQGGSGLSMIDWYRTENENMTNINSVSESRPSVNGTLEALPCSTNIPVSQGLS